MQIQVTEEKPDIAREFDRIEWKTYEKDHFGQEIVWDTKKFFLTASDEDEIMGTCEVRIEGGVCKIHTLLVKKEKQRQGIGKALVMKVEEIAREHGAHKLFLQTGQDWESVKFYEKLGFQKTGERLNHFFHIDFIEMAKFIG